MSGSTASPVLTHSKIAGLELHRRGKVRDIYDLGDAFLFIATDRLSAFDVVFAEGIPDKGRILTQLSLFWFERLGVPHHVISTRLDDLPPECAPHAAELRDRCVIVEKLDILPIECIVRGYLAGSGWEDYRKTGGIAGLRLPAGLVQSSRLPEPIFTPSTKAEQGHDINISFAEAERIAGAQTAARLRDLSLAVYEKAAAYAIERGIIVADTKLEWGVRPATGEIVLADEALTPDSSRFWPADAYAPGRAQPSFDKQFVRDYLLTLDWDRSPPPPPLPPEVIAGTRQRYAEIFERLTGRRWS